MKGFMFIGEIAFVYLFIGLLLGFLIGCSPKVRDLISSIESFIEQEQEKRVGSKKKELV